MNFQKLINKRYYIKYGLLFTACGWLSSNVFAESNVQLDNDNQVKVSIQARQADSMPGAEIELASLSHQPSTTSSNSDTGKASSSRDEVSEITGLAWLSERMAIIFSEIGFYEAAEEIVKDSLRIWKKSWGTYYPHYCYAPNQLDDHSGLKG